MSSKCFKKNAALLSVLWRENLRNDAEQNNTKGKGKNVFQLIISHYLD